MTRAITDIPRMTTDADVEAVRLAVSQVPEGTIAVEFGPWLGGLSVVISERLDLHVVDRFSWTSDHAKKAPDRLTVGEDFQPLLEKTFADAKLAATIHKSAFDRFEWSGGEIAMIIVDGPKSAPALRACLSGVINHLGSSGRVLIKNGLSPLYGDMTAYLERLVSSDVLRVARQSVPASSNVLVLEASTKLHDFDQLKPFDPDWAIQASLGEKVNLAEDHPYRFLKVLAAVAAADWGAAFDLLAKMPVNHGLADAWRAISTKPLKTSSNAALIDQLSEAVIFHHTQPSKDALPIEFNESRDAALRGFWSNTLHHDWRAGAYQPEIMTRAFEFGYMDWPSKIREHVYGKDVLDIGCGPGLHGLGYLAAGAKSYLGLDPILQSDRDRSKNLTKSKKEPFGWTPSQISRAIAPWHASAEAIGDTPKERRFDLCTMHNVTEHLHQLEDIFVDIAARLRVGGKLLYNHHNFYCWNGHHLPPKTVSKLNLDDPKQVEMIDWKHINYVPEPDHYIARGLNRIKLDELIVITKRYFDIDEMIEIPSRTENGIDRLTDEIRAEHPDLDDRDLTTQNLFCVATVRT